jgi:hypothetical protein
VTADRLRRLDGFNRVLGVIDDRLRRLIRCGASRVRRWRGQGYEVVLAAVRPESWLLSRV